jgi:hypothetical protein
MEILSNALFVIFSEGTDVAGTANIRFAITENRGYLVEWGFF